MCAQGPIHIRPEEWAWGLEAGGWLAWICSEYNSAVEFRGVQAGVGFLGLMEDSPCPSSRSDITFSVRVGSPWIDQVTKTTIDTLAEEVIVHSRYRAHRYWSWIGRANDIALLNLERPLQYSKYVWPICLPGLDYSLKDYSLCTVTGWGAPRADGESAPSYSQQGGMCGREPGCRPGSTMDRNF